MNIQFLEILLAHIMVSILPGAPGALIGIALGRLVAPRPQNTEVEKANNSSAWYWIPWRGALVSLVVILLSSPYPLIWFGLGVLPVSLTIFLSCFALASVLSVEARLRHPGRLTRAENDVRIFRTVATASVGLGIVSFMYGAGGAGGLIWNGARQFDYDLIWLGYAVVAILAVLADVLAGVLGWIYLRREDV